MPQRINISAPNHLPLSPSLRRIAGTPRVYRAAELGLPTRGQSEFLRKTFIDPDAARRVESGLWVPRATAVDGRAAFYLRLYGNTVLPALDRRSEMTTTIVTHLDAGQTVLIRGPIRTGKTTQAGFAMERLWQRDRKIAVKIICRVPGFVTASSDLNKILKEGIVKAVSQTNRLTDKSLLAELEALPQEAEFPLLLWLDAWLGKQGIRALIHIDEAVRFLQQKQACHFFCEQLESLKNCSVLVDLHGYQSNDAMAAMIKNSATVWIRPLSLSVATHYVREALSLGSPYFTEIDEPVYGLIASYAGGRMVTIREVLEHLDEMIHQSSHNLSRYFERQGEGFHLTVSGIKAYLANESWEFWKADLANITNLKWISAKQREILVVLAINPEEPQEQYEAADLEFLLNMGFLTHMADGRVKVLGTQFREWLEENQATL